VGVRLAVKQARRSSSQVARLAGAALSESRGRRYAERGSVVLPRGGRPLPLALAVSLLAACGPRTEQRLEGRTMGTTYHVTLVGVTPERAAPLHRRIDARLEQVNDSMSTYRPESELCRFNRLDRAGEPFAVSADMLAVMRTALRVFDLSAGAWDGTVMPLVNLWGFGPAGPRSEPPADEEIEALRAHVGFAAIEVRPGALVKRDPAVTLDLGSIAKGYGVDVVAALLRSEGLRDFIVEVGGEVYAAGARRDGRPWRVGINRPRAEAAPDDLIGVASLREQAFATSGDYRNYFTSDGARYSHILDPRTGRPVANGVVSVSVQAPDCTLADGLATAVTVMGADAGVALLERLDAVEGLVIVEARDGSLVERRTSGFRLEPVALAR
jgi:thiamine biosynthesis lipoprotein